MELNRWLPMILLIEIYQRPLIYQADLIVAKDDSGNFTTVNEAVAAAPENNAKRFVIYVKKGVYKEVIHVGKKKKNLTIIGDN
ncbi:Pectin lyase fold/virulence factor, partial [Arabidopsis thaliana x Arabidopsis arenosa]